jgi:hypothetical protein
LLIDACLIAAREDVGQALEQDHLCREPPRRHPGEGGGGSLLQGRDFFVVAILSVNLI